MISEQDILKLQDIIKRNYGVELSFEETSKVANDWIAVFEVLAEIDYREKFEKN
ncbi:MAG: hypothetical protein ABIH87_03290 [bacterium]